MANRANRNILLVIGTLALSAAAGVCVEYSRLVPLVIGGIVAVGTLLLTRRSLRPWLLLGYVVLNIVGPPLPITHSIVAEPADFPGACLLLCAVSSSYSSDYPSGIARGTWALAFVALLSCPMLLITDPHIAVTSILRASRLLFVAAAVSEARALVGGRSVKLRTLARAVAVAGTIGNLFGVAQTVFAINPPWPSSGQDAYLQGIVLPRGVGLVGESSNFGLLALLTFALLYFAGELLEVKPWLRVTALAISVAGVVASLSRATILALVVFLVIASVRRAGRGQRFLIFAVVGIASLFLLAIPTISHELSSRVLATTSAGSGNQLLSGRIRSWRVILSSVASSPPWVILFGHGYKSLSPLLSTPYETVFGDNNFVTLLFEAGVAGLAAGMMAWTAVVGELWQTRHYEELVSPRVMSAVETSNYMICCLLAFALIGDVFTYTRILGPLLTLAAGSALVARSEVAAVEGGRGGAVGAPRSAALARG